jgi:hypothetical protein
MILSDFPDVERRRILRKFRISRNRQLRILEHKYSIKLSIFSILKTNKREKLSTAIAIPGRFVQQGEIN